MGVREGGGSNVSVLLYKLFVKLNFLFPIPIVDPFYNPLDFVVRGPTSPPLIARIFVRIFPTWFVP